MRTALACSVLLSASMAASAVPASAGSVFWPRLRARSLQPSPRSSYGASGHGGAERLTAIGQCSRTLYCSAIAAELLQRQ